MKKQRSFSFSFVIVMFLVVAACNLVSGGSINRRYISSYKSYDSSPRSQWVEFNSNDPKLNRALKSLDVSLIRSVDHKIDGLTEGQKAQFREDILDLNTAVTNEYNRVVNKYRWRDSESDAGYTPSDKDIGRAVVQRIIVDYQSKPWYKRIKKFVGGRLKPLVRKLVSNLNQY